VTPIRLRPSTTITPTRAGVLLRSDLGTFRVTGAHQGAFLSLLRPLLDGTRDRAAVQAALDGYSPASVAAFLDQLTERGLIEEVPEGARDDGRRGQAELLGRWTGAPADATRRLAAAKVVVAGSTPWGDAAVAALGAAGLGAVERLGARGLDAEASLLLAAVPAGDAAALEQIARVAHRAGVRSLWSHLDGDRALLGPLTVPGRTACRICAAAEAINRSPGLVPADPGTPPGARSGAAAEARAGIRARVLGHLVALEVVKVVSAYTRSALGGRVLALDLSTFETRLCTLVRLPWCRVCGRGSVP
jgi:bacteriocin biosynthesis cyclodehydratase domain-containing protein